MRLRSVLIKGIALMVSVVVVMGAAAATSGAEVVVPLLCLILQVTIGLWEK